MTNFLQNDVLKKSHSRAYDDENIENEHLIRTSLMGLLALLDIIEDKIN